MSTNQKLDMPFEQYQEILKRIEDGRLDQLAVVQAFQDIIEGKLPQVFNYSPPSWWRTPKQQMELAQLLWPSISIPEPPKVFIPKSTNSVLLLHVPVKFESLWSAIVGPSGHTKLRWRGIEPDAINLRLTPNKVDYDQPVWLELNYGRGKGECPNKFVDREDNAANEILSAIIQFPDWPLSWFSISPAPYLSGFQFEHDWGRSATPYFDRHADSKILELRGHLAGSQNMFWSSPSVVPC